MSKTKEQLANEEVKSTEVDTQVDVPVTNETEQPTGMDKFVFMDSTKKALDIAYNTGKNLILFGKGGHGKSEISVEYLKSKGHDPFIITMGSGMDTDRLFGGTDLQTFDETGKIEYNVEYSFMNREIVIFEELFDAPDFILEQLKDILSSGVFRNGDQQFKIKTKLIICCTNKKREDFAKNDSLRALMERFPLEHKVEWNSYNKMMYEKLFKTRYGKSNPKLCFILEEFWKEKGVENISPRIALDAFDVIDQCGEDCLEYIAEFGQNPSLLQTSLKRFESIDEIIKIKTEMEDVKKDLKKYLDKLEGEDPLNKEELEAFKEIGQSSKRHYDKIESLKVSDEFVQTKSEVKTQIKSVRDSVREIADAIENLGLLDD